MTERLVQIDEEGYPAFGEIRVSDQEIGQEILKNIARLENGTFCSKLESEKFVVEAFDAPLIARNCEVTSEGLKLIFPYDIGANADWKSLTVDEWDRFHGRLANGVPFVLSRTAQATLFQQVDSFEDDSVTVAGKTIAILPWLPQHAEIQRNEFWSERYKSSETGWELNAPAPALVDMLPRMKWPKSRVLILGCGSGNDAAFFADAGHIVTAVDFSEEALNRASEKYKAKENIRWIKQDALKLPAEYRGQFDVVFEHTCYCAIDPSLRQKLVSTWVSCLTDKGHLMAVMFVHDKFEGPPYGGSEWEIRQRLKKYFQFQFWGRWKDSVPNRVGTEIFIFAQKK